MEDDLRRAAMDHAETAARAAIAEQRAAEEATFTPSAPDEFPQPRSRARQSVDALDHAADEMAVRRAALEAGYPAGGGEFEKLVSEAMEEWGPEAVRRRLREKWERQRLID